MSLVFCHTADWHLGRTLHGVSFDRAHQRFLAWLVELVAARGVDVLVIAGDVFDRSVPSASAEALFYGFLAELARAAPGVQVVVIAGNHDGPARLAAPAPLLERLGGARLSVRILGTVATTKDGAIDPEGAIIPLRTRHDGVVRGQLLAVPFLRPSELSCLGGGACMGGGASGGAAESARRLFAELVAHASARRGEAPSPEAPFLMAVAHGHVRGARLSPESERPLLGGDDAALPCDVFPAALDYVALGHLHLAQALDDGRLRYAGAPLPLAFSERAYPHQVVIGRARTALERSRGERSRGESSVVIEPVSVPRFVELVRIAGEADGALAVEEAIARLAAQTKDEHERWVQVRVRVSTPRPALRRELTEALAASGARLVSVDVERSGDAALVPVPSSAYAELAPDAVLARVWSGVSSEPVPATMTNALHEAWREAQREHDGELAEAPDVAELEVADLEVAS